MTLDQVTIPLTSDYHAMRTETIKVPDQGTYQSQLFAYWSDEFRQTNADHSAYIALNFAGVLDACRSKLHTLIQHHSQHVATTNPAVSATAAPLPACKTPCPVRPCRTKAASAVTSGRPHAPHCVGRCPRGSRLAPGADRCGSPLLAQAPLTPCASPQYASA